MVCWSPNIEPFFFWQILIIVLYGVYGMETKVLYFSDYVFEIGFVILVPPGSQIIMHVPILIKKDLFLHFYTQFNFQQ